MKTMNLQRILLLTGLFLNLLWPADGYGQPYKTDWALKIESPWGSTNGDSKSDDYRASIAVDGEGCSVITGGFSSAVIELGGKTLTRTTIGNDGELNFMDFYVARYHPDGTLDWVRQAGGQMTHCVGKDVATDGDGNIVVTGYYWEHIGNQLDFYNGNVIEGFLYPYVAGAAKDIFIARYSKFGVLLWVKRAGGISARDEGVAVSCGPGGSIFITGHFAGEAVFGEGEEYETTLVSGESIDIFVARYNPDDGSLAWAKQVTGGSEVHDIASDGNGNCMIAGNFANTITFNPDLPEQIIVTGNENGNMFVACLGDGGTVLWVRSADSDFYNTANSVDTDSEGNTILTGAYEGSIIFDGEITLPGEQYILNTFIAKYGPSGTLLWAKKAGGSSGDVKSYAEGLGLVTDNADNILVTGTFGGEVTFGEGSRTVEMTSSGYDPQNTETWMMDIFTLKCDPSGNLLWARSDGGMGEDEGDAIAVGPDGSIFVTGYFDDDATFGDGLTNSTTLTTEGKKYNLFVVKILESDLPLEITSLTGPVIPFPVNTEAVLGVSFTGKQVTGATINWGDGNSSSQENPVSPFTANHAYAEAGVYPVTVTVVNAGNQSDAETWYYCVVYDPSAGFVTGGGWIISPPGAYKADPGLTGKANFGFVSKYKKGQSIPEGNTEFQFKTAGLNFRSSVYEWLVIAGSKAMFKGSGSINGAGDYGFLLSGIDGDMAENQTTDKFRIKIWDKNNGKLVVYDNNANDDLNADPETSISGGSVVIHSNVKKSAVMKNPVSLPGYKPGLNVYPNPFTDKLWFELTTPETVRASIDLYDVTGRKVVRLLDRILESGESCRVEYVPDAGVGTCLLYRVILGSEVFNGKVICRK